MREPKFWSPRAILQRGRSNAGRVRRIAAADRRAGRDAETAAIATHADRGKSWMLPEAKNEDLIYATSGCGGVCMLSYPAGKLVGQH